MAYDRGATRPARRATIVVGLSIELVVDSLLHIGEGVTVTIDRETIGLAADLVSVAGSIQRDGAFGAGQTGGAGVDARVVRRFRPSPGTGYRTPLAAIGAAASPN